MLKIIGKDTSINVRKVLWTCRELGLPFEREDWNPEHARLNPNALVPVLVDEGFVLWESNTICRYLCNRHGATALLPREAGARARVEQWMDWVAYDMTFAMKGAYLGGELGLEPWAHPLFVAQGRAEYATRMGQLDATLAVGGPWLAGEGFTLADIPAGFVVHRWFSLRGVERPGMPALSAYYGRLSERPAYRAHVRNGLP